MSMLNNPPDSQHAMYFREGSQEMVANTSDTVLYLWLNDGRSFWYYVTYSFDTYLEGYYWTETKWIYTMIPLDHIKAYY